MADIYDEKPSRSVSREDQDEVQEKEKDTKGSSAVVSLTSASDHAIHVSAKQADEGADLVVGWSGELDPAESLRVRRKIDRHILPLMMTLYFVQFMDKTTLGNSAILGIQKANHLNASQYNWLGTIFYLAYLVFEYPQNLAMQRLPVGKWMTLNISIWAVALCCHAACHSFGGLFAVRFVLGMCEGSITAGFMIVSSMFYTHKEQAQRVGYWFLMNGTAQIVSGLLAYGVLHIKTGGFEPWQWFMIITGAITIILAVCFFFFFPDSPATAWFLTPEERIIAIERIKVNQTGIGNKTFKMHQFWETLRDPKTWLFCLFSAVDNIPNSLTNQMSIIVNSFGFTTLQTTLLGCVSGVVEIVTIFTAVTIVAHFPNSRAYVSVIYFIPNILGSILQNALPWSDKVGLLFALWITGVGTSGFVLSLAWVTSVTAGHTKRVTTQAIMLIGYCVGNLVGPQMWTQQYKPRNRVPWAVITICYFVCPVLLLIIRYILVRENKRRDRLAADPNFSADQDEVGVIEVVGEDGKKSFKKVDRAFLDLTDRENLQFRYVL